MFAGYFAESQQGPLASALSEALAADGWTLKTAEYNEPGVAVWIGARCPRSGCPALLYEDERVLGAMTGLLLAFREGEPSRWLDFPADFGQLYRTDPVGLLRQIDTNAALAWYDKRSGTLSLASSRASTLRLYHTRVQNATVFGTDFRVMCRVAGFHLDPAGLYSIFRHGAAAEPITLAQAVAVVPIGHFVSYDRRGRVTEPAPHYRFDFSGSDRPADVERDLPLVDALLDRLHQPFGLRAAACSISGGVDSTIMALRAARVCNQPGPLFFVSFDRGDPERKYAAAVARKLSTHLHEVMVTPDRVETALERFTAYYDHPFSDYSTIAACVMFEEVAKVMGSSGGILLDGSGGDGAWGFPAIRRAALTDKLRGLFRPLRHVVRWGAPRAYLGLGYHLRRSHGWFGRGLAFATRLTEGTLAKSCMVQNCWEGIFYQFEQQDVERAEQELVEAHRQLLAPGQDDCLALLNVVDMMQVIGRMTSAKVFRPGLEHGIDVEMPFHLRSDLDVATHFPWATKVLGGEIKYPLKNLAAREMGHEFAYRPKSGFSTVDRFESWARRSTMMDMLRELVRPSSTVSVYLNSKRIVRVLDWIWSGRPISSPVAALLWGALFVELWIRRYIRPGRASWPS